MSYLSPDYSFKIIVVGNSGVGKTSLLMRLCDDIFSNVYISTIGIDFKIKTFTLDNDYVKLQIWDTAGQDRFNTIVSSYYRNINALIVVFDLSNLKSFTDIDTWISNCNKYSDTTNVFTFIIGSKSDIKCSSITDSMIANVCIKYNATYMETSSKDNINISQTFELLCKKLIETNKFSYKSNIYSTIQLNNTQNNHCCTN